MICDTGHPSACPEDSDTWYLGCVERSLSRGLHLSVAMTLHWKHLVGARQAVAFDRILVSTHPTRVLGFQSRTRT
jgi:hypothetical protein